MGRPTPTQPTPVPFDKNTIEVGAANIDENGMAFSHVPMTPHTDWETVKDVGGMVANEVVPQILPMAGGYLGARAGGMGGARQGMRVGQQANAGISALLASMGAGAGEAINQELGVTAKDPNQVAFVAATELGAYGAGLAGRKYLLGRPAAAVEMQDVAVQEMRKIPSMINMPSRAINPRTLQPYNPDDMYERIRHVVEAGRQGQIWGGPNKIPQVMSDIKVGNKHQLKAAQEILDDYANNTNPVTNDNSVFKLADAVRTNKPPGGLMDMSQWDKTRQMYGKESKYNGVPRTDDFQQANGKLYKAMYDDLDETIKHAENQLAKSGTRGTTIAPETLKELKLALSVHRMEKTKADLDEFISGIVVNGEKFQPKGILKQPDTGFEYVDAKALGRYIRDDKWIKTLPAEDRHAMLSVVDKIAAFPRLPPPGRADRGSGRNLASAGLGSLTLGIAEYSGLMTHSPALGYMATGLALALPQALAYTLTTEGGRALIRGMMKNSQGTITPIMASVIVGFANAATNEPGSRMFDAPQPQQPQGMMP